MPGNKFLRVIVPVLLAFAVSAGIMPLEVNPVKSSQGISCLENLLK